MKTTMFKKFFTWIKGAPKLLKAVPNIVKMIPTKIKSAKGWAIGIYTVFIQPFIKRLCAFINALVVPTPKVAK